jgi:U3 small nucleolar RNA-associated protein MPP10
MLEYALNGPEEPTEDGVTSTTDDSEQDSSEEEDSDLTYVESDGNSETDEEPRGSSDGEQLEEGVTGLRDPSVDREEEELVRDSRISSSSLGTNGDHSGLDDGFFDLKEFNAETEEAEAGFVSNGALNADSDNIASDEDDVDYFASVDAQLHANDDHGMPIALFVMVPSRDYNPVRTTLFRLF